MMSINFISMDSSLHYSVPCIKTDVFAHIEEKLYKKFPKYKETNNTFLVNGAIVLRFKTIAENKLENGLRKNFYYHIFKNIKTNNTSNKHK